MMYRGFVTRNKTIIRLVFNYLDNGEVADETLFIVYSFILGDYGVTVVVVGNVKTLQRTDDILKYDSVVVVKRFAYHHYAERCA